MVTKIQKWGNSQGLRLAKEVLAQAHIEVGDEVEIAVNEGVIMVAPVKQVRGGHRLEELISRIPPDYKAQEVPWGSPAGREAW